MGNKTANQQPSTGKKQLKPQQIKELDVLLHPVKKWDWATRILGSYAKFSVGYRHVTFQTPEQWVASFRSALLKPDYWSERNSILNLNTLSRLRSGLILFLMYLLTQHGRIQILKSAHGPDGPDSGYPLDELSGNHHNLDYLLLRLLGQACNVIDAPPKHKPNPIMRIIVRLARLVMGPGVDKLAPYTMARWVHVADVAGGFTPRSADRIYKNWKSTAALPSKDLFAKTQKRFREALALATPLYKAIIVFGACCSYLLYRFVAHGHLFVR